MSGKDSVPHAFGVALFDDQVYWTDWSLMGVMSADKFGLSGKDTKQLWVMKASGVYPMGIIAYHKSRQLLPEDSKVIK